MKKLLPLIALISCGSTMIISPNEKPLNAPVNYLPTGQISYTSSGASWFVNKRKESAYKKMSDACNGGYRILSDSSRGDGAFALSNGFGGYNISTTEKTYINFECVVEKPANNDSSP